MLFSGPDNPLKLSIPLGDLSPRLTHGSLSPGPPDSSAPLNGAKLGSAIFADHVTNRDTDRPHPSVAVAHTLCNAFDAA